MTDASADASTDGVSVSHRPFVRVEGDDLAFALFGGGDGELQPKVRCWTDTRCCCEPNRSSLVVICSRAAPTFLLNLAWITAGERSWGRRRCNERTVAERHPCYLKLRLMRFHSILLSISYVHALWV